MPRNASGTYSLPDPPVVPGTTIESADENTTRDDIATEITASLDRSGRGGMLAPLRLYDGTLALPGLAFTADLNTGIYRSANDTFHFVSGSVLAGTVAPTYFGLQPGGVDTIRATAVPSAVNYWDFRGAIAAGTITVTATGASTDISQRLIPKGAGTIQVTDGADTTKIAALEVGSLTTATTRTYTFPDANIKFAGHATGLTANRIPYATGATGGLLTDSAALSFDGSKLTIGGMTNGRLAITGASSLLTDSATFTYTDSATSRALSISGSGSTSASLTVDNTHASAPAFIHVTTTGSPGDTYFRTDGGVTGTQWYFGSGGADGHFFIGQGTVFGSNVLLKIDDQNIYPDDPNAFFLGFLTSPWGGMYIQNNGSITWGSSAEVVLQGQSTGVLLLTGFYRQIHLTEPFGYAGGSGSSVTQATSKSTGVTIDTPTGRIIMHNASLGAGAEVTFTVTCASCDINCVVAIHRRTSGTAGAYMIVADTVAAGSFTVTVTNLTAGALGEAIQLNYAIIQGQIT